jgi:hypothetical protein
MQCQPPVLYDLDFLFPHLQAELLSRQYARKRANRHWAETLPLGSGRDDVEKTYLSLVGPAAGGRGRDDIGNNLPEMNLKDGFSSRSLRRFFY